MSKPSRSEHLIIQTAFLGDLLLGIPLFKQLRSLKPDDKITVLCRKGLGDFLVQAKLVDEVVEVDKSSAESWARVQAELRQRRFEWLFCPHESLRSARLAWKLKAERKVGYKRWFNLFVFSDRIERPMELPEALRQLALLEPLGTGERLPEFSQALRGGLAADGSLVAVPEWASMTVPRLAKVRANYLAAGGVGEMSSEHVKKRAAGWAGKPLVFIAPGSVWATKMWTADGYTRVAREYIARGARVVIMGSPSEKKICEEIAFRAPGSISIAGEPSLYESAELLALASLLICNDSGAMHMAAAGGVPLVSIFGPTVLDLGYRPWENPARVVQTQLACRPCGKHGAQVCPIGTHDCMKRVSAEAVLKAADELATAQI